MKLPFRLGNRFSILAALDIHGFFGWEWTTSCTFRRAKFQSGFLRCFFPHLNHGRFDDQSSSWIMRRFTCIQNWKKLYTSAVLVFLFLPPYCTQINPIEVCFGLLKRWLQKHANLIFSFYRDLVLALAMRVCTNRESVDCAGTFRHCGYMSNTQRSTI